MKEEQKERETQQNTLQRSLPREERVKSSILHSSLQAPLSSMLSLSFFRRITFLSSPLSPTLCVCVCCQWREKFNNRLCKHEAFIFNRISLLESKERLGRQACLPSHEEGSMRWERGRQTECRTAAADKQSKETRIRRGKGIPPSIS